MSNTENWSDYWQKEGASGEVFVDQQGNKHQELGKFWKQQLADQPAGAVVIDLASGAGSIFADLDNRDQYELHAADISAQALAQLSERFEGVKTHVCSADQLPLEDETVDVAVSQFGIEYAGHVAFIEAARIVKSGGRLVVLCHIEDGYIDARNKAELFGAELVKNNGFVNRAKNVINAIFDKNEQATQTAIQAFTEVEPAVAEYAANVPQGVHVHLHQGFKQLFGRKQHYLREDIIGWLDGMTGEIDKAIMRLTEMRKAANSEQNMMEIKAKLEQAGMLDIQISPLLLSNHIKPVAWQLTCHK